MKNHLFLPAMTTIIEAKPEHLPIIHKLAYHIWPAAFNGILTEEQIAYMLEWMYSIPSLQRQYDHHHHFLLAKENSQYQGYASYEINEASGITKLHKLYVHPASQGKGIGKQILIEVINSAKTAKQTFLQLNVNRYNKAVTFYQKSGFRILREENNPIGNGYFMNDYVMELIL